VNVEDIRTRTKAVLMSGVLRGYAVVFLSSILGPGIWGWVSGDVGVSRRGVVGLVVLAPFGLVIAPLFAILTTPIVWVGGALNALLCMAVLKTPPGAAVLSNNEYLDSSVKG
jgi:hypothetical protein